MKRAGFSSILLLIIFAVIRNQSFASSYGVSSNINVYTEGDSTATVKSTTNSTSSNTSTSNIHTRIEIDNNGEKKILDEDGPGNYSVESNSNGGTTSVKVSNNSDDSNSVEDDQKDSTKSAQKDKEREGNHQDIKEQNIISKFIESFKDILERIFKNL